MQRNIKWRLHNIITIFVTILQPMLWLFLYGGIGKQTMEKAGINNYIEFITPGLVILISFAACSSGGIINYLMKADGSFYRIIIAPIRKNEIVLGHILETVMCSFFEVLIMFVCAFFMGARIQSGVLGCFCIVIIVLLTQFFISGLTYAISLSLPNEIIYEMIMNAIVLPIFFLSSALFPAEALHGGFATIVKINPFTYVIETIRGLMIQTNPVFTNVIYVVAALIVLCFITFGISYAKLLKEVK